MMSLSWKWGIVLLVRLVYVGWKVQTDFSGVLEPGQGEERQSAWRTGPRQWLRPPGIRRCSIDPGQRAARAALSRILKLPKTFLLKFLLRKRTFLVRIRTDHLFQEYVQKQGQEWPSISPHPNLRAFNHIFESLATQGQNYFQGIIVWVNTSMIVNPSWTDAGGLCTTDKKEQAGQMAI